MKVLLVDVIGHLLFTQGLHSLLQAGGIDVAGIAFNGQNALSLVRSLKPDVIIININENVRSSLKTLRRIHDEIPSAGIIVFAGSNKHISAAQREGASGFLLTKIKGSELIDKLHEMEPKAYARS